MGRHRLVSGLSDQSPDDPDPARADTRRLLSRIRRLPQPLEKIATNSQISRSVLEESAGILTDTGRTRDVDRTRARRAHHFTRRRLFDVSWKANSRITTFTSKESFRVHQLDTLEI